MMSLQVLGGHGHVGSRLPPASSVIAETALQVRNPRRPPGDRPRRTRSSASSPLLSSSQDPRIFPPVLRTLAEAAGGSFIVSPASRPPPPPPPSLSCRTTFFNLIYRPSWETVVVGVALSGLPNLITAPRPPHPSIPFLPGVVLTVT